MMCRKIVGIVLLILSVVFFILILSCIKDAIRETQNSTGLNRIGEFLVSFLADSWQLFGLLFVTALIGLIFVLK